MSAAIATAESVKTALTELRAAGISPTADAVIKRLGGGSKSTVLLHLRQLLKDETPFEVLPSLLIDQVRPALAELFLAGAAAEGEKGRARLDRQDRLLDEMEQQLIDMEAELQNLRHEVAKLVAERDRLAFRCSGLENNLVSREVELRSATQQLDLARDQAAAGFAQLLARVESSVEALATRAVAAER